jgi:hypothetical protein
VFITGESITNTNNSTNLRKNLNGCDGALCHLGRLILGGPLADLLGQPQPHVPGVVNDMQVVDDPVVEVNRYYELNGATGLVAIELRS